MDPIANMLVSIKNGYLARKGDISVPFSKFKLEIAKILEKENLVGPVNAQDTKIKIGLSYEGQKPKIKEIKRVSKLGLRVYTKSKKIPYIKNGKGLVILSTSKGVMTGQEAKSKKLGGEIICKIW